MNNPFSEWGFIPSDEFISAPVQRDAEWFKAMEPELEDVELNGIGAFFDGGTCPTPQLMNICAISCPEGEGCGDGGDGGNDNP